jgi:serine-type D-Ala-D-Ala carboxypeptidase (penicillin-binding protein 5/6)
MIGRVTSPNFLRRRLVVAFLLAVILIIGVGVPAALLAPVPQAQATVSPAVALVTNSAKPNFPGFGHAAIGMVGRSGVLATAGSQGKRPIASITKVVTALVVLEKRPLGANEPGPTIVTTDRDVTILEEVLAMNGSFETVQPGWRLTERQVLETMLIPSANNYAKTLALWAYGSESAYLKAAKAFLAAHHLTHTTVVDTNGLHSGDESTPADLVSLGKLALASPVLTKIVNTKSKIEPHIGQIENTNELLGEHGVDGVKTGTTDEAGACLLFSARITVGGVKATLVGVILGAPSHPELDATVPPLLASVKKGLHALPIAKAGQPFATYHTAWGGIARAVAARDATVLVWSKKAIDRSASASPIRGGTKGDHVGTVQYAIDHQRISIPLKLDRSVLAAPFWWRLLHPLR